MAPLPLALHPPDAAVPIRPVRADDAAALRARCWPERSLAAVQRHVAHAERMARRSAGLGIVVDAGDGALAYGQWTRWPGCDEISDLVVASVWRGRGLGTALVQHLCAAARTGGAGCVELGALVGNGRALALYRRLGFADHHTRDMLVDGREVAVRYLRLTLPPDVGA